MDQTFGQWVQEVIDREYGGVAGRLAEAIGVTLTTLTRGMETGTMGTDTLLRLAMVTGRDASDLLRHANKAEWAELIERNYGPPRVVAPSVRATIDLLEELPVWAGPLTVQWLTGIRNAWLVQAASDTAAGATKATTIRKPAKRAVRGKSKAGRVTA